MKQEKKEKIFTRYEAFIIAILAILQFTIILDFMVLAPLGAQLLTELNITTKQFGLVVSAYAISAGVSGLLAAGFADKFDRKKLLLFFYSGFIIGTLLCGIAPDYNFLLLARIVTGIFGGVMGSVVFAIVTDIFAMKVRGRVMGFVQMAFSASQILGLPFGLYLANHFGWHFPFLLIVVVSIVAAIVIAVYMKPIDAHLKLRMEKPPLRHLVDTIANTRYLKGFSATILLAIGGFMLMPFGTAFAVNNLGIAQEKLPMMYFITGLFTIVMGPLSGKLSDKFGKYNIFVFGSVLSAIIVLYYCGLSESSLAFVIALNVLLFMGITARMIAGGALMTAVPQPQDRGAYMSVNASVQYLSGGIASYIAGSIVYQSADGKMHNYQVLGYVVASAIAVTVGLMYVINNMVKNNPLNEKPAEEIKAEDILLTEAE